MQDFGKKILAIFLALVFSVGTVCAAENTKYADELYSLGLFQGTDIGYELDKSLTREEAATMLVRLLGEEKNVDVHYDVVFDDVPADRWSFPYVMYCYKNEITKGTGDNTFSPENPISSQEFVTLVLRLLGYTYVEPETALTDCVHLYLLNSEVARELGKKAFVRDDMVYIAYRSLMTKMSGGEILANFLADDGVITKEQAKKFDIFNNEDYDIVTMLELFMG